MYGSGHTASSSVATASVENRTGRAMGEAIADGCCKVGYSLNKSCSDSRKIEASGFFIYSVEKFVGC